ncbi:hypothetical protein AMECASPLE_025705 [Ameca splendens]|uniref:Uncharacterized protein n=1 Tax=Ameca splendens TaxID=208324 RepID=A0ABV0YRP2_9TELE
MSHCDITPPSRSDSRRPFRVQKTRVQNQNNPTRAGGGGLGRRARVQNTQKKNNPTRRKTKAYDEGADGQEACGEVASEEADDPEACGKEARQTHEARSQAVCDVEAGASEVCGEARTVAKSWA